MNLVDARLRGWYSGGEAKEYLSREVGSPIEQETVFVAAIRPKGVRLFLHIPPNTKDKRGQILDEGLWDLVTERTDQGTPARHHLSKLINDQTPLEGITGAFIKRDRDKQSPRELNPFVWQGKAVGAWPLSCTLAFKKEDLDLLAKKLKIETPTPAPEAAEKSDKPLGTRERETLLTIIAALLRKSKIDTSNPTRAAKTIVTEVELFGGKMHWQTVDDKLKQVKELIKWLETQEIK